LIGWQLSLWNCCYPFLSLLYNCQLLCFWRIAVSIVGEVFIIYDTRINILKHAAFYGTPTLYPATQHMSRSVPEMYGDGYGMGFGVQGVGRKLFGHEGMKVIVCL
jgi:hypothetical protein